MLSCPVSVTPRFMDPARRVRRRYVNKYAICEVCEVREKSKRPPKNTCDARRSESAPPDADAEREPSFYKSGKPTMQSAPLICHLSLLRTSFVHCMMGKTTSDVMEDRVSEVLSLQGLVFLSVCAVRATATRICPAGATSAEFLSSGFSR